jgi:outer membrane receptor for Fe3+-dicitrate
VIRNVEGFQYLTPTGQVIGTLDPFRKYRALMMVLNKRYSNRWHGQISYVWSKGTGNVDNTSGQQIASSIFETPVRSLVNTNGRVTNDRPHEFKVLAGYQIPRAEVAVNAFFRTFSGRNYTPFQRYSNSQLNNSPSSRRDAWLEPRGSRRLPTDTTLDVRIEKVFAFGGRDKVGLFADITNIFNRSTVTNRLTRVPTTEVTVGPGETVNLPLDSPGAIVAPRQAQFGFRWSF